MKGAALSGLADICARHFTSLGDAVSSVLTLLERELPPGRVTFAELNYDADEYRILDAHGEGPGVLEAGTRLPLRESFCMHMIHGGAPSLVGHASADPVYAQLDLRRSAGVESYAGAQVAFGNGTCVGSVCAMSTDPDRYDESDLALLTIGARLIAHEWAYVTHDAELRRLAQQQRAPTADQLTGLLLRAIFVQQLEREWHLAQRGIVETYVVAIKPLGLEQVRSTSGNAVANLLLQTTSESILAESRRTDIAGRVGDDIFGVILVGCRSIDGVAAFRERLERAFERRLNQRPERLRLACGAVRLTDAPSAASALECAEHELVPTPRIGIP
jgi:diguanylate cyclase